MGTTKVDARPDSPRTLPSTIRSRMIRRPSSSLWRRASSRSISTARPGQPLQVSTRPQRRRCPVPTGPVDANRARPNGRHKRSGHLLEAVTSAGFTAGQATEVDPVYRSGRTGPVGDWIILGGVARAIGGGGTLGRTDLHSPTGHSSPPPPEPESRCYRVWCRPGPTLVGGLGHSVAGGRRRSIARLREHTLLHCPPRDALGLEPVPVLAGPRGRRSCRPLRLIAPSWRTHRVPGRSGAAAGRGSGCRAIRPLPEPPCVLVAWSA